MSAEEDSRSERSGGRYLSKPRESYKIKTEIISENWLNTNKGIKKKRGRERERERDRREAWENGKEKKKKAEICKCLPMNSWEF